MNTPLYPVIPNPATLDKFIKVYGNRYRRFHFIALRFKRAIITYNSNSLDTVPIAPPNNSIIVIRGKCPPITLANQSFLLFAQGNRERGIPVANSSTECLLRALFPHNKILFSYFKSDILFLIATENRYFGIMKKCRKDQAFKTLCNLVDARLKKRALTLSEVSNFRFFKRYNDDLKQFNKWTSFAFHLGNDACIETTLSHPSAYLGREVFLILKRSGHPPGELPPPDFYQCELILDTGPLGIAYSVSKGRDLEIEYVSSMVVSNPQADFKDTGGVVCNDWLPLYQNRETWQHFGMAYYIHGLHFKRYLLKHILTWLQIQTSKKYDLIYKDLVHVAKILFGEEAKEFCKPE